MNNVNHHALVVDDFNCSKHVAQLLEHQYIRTTQAQNGSDALHKLAETPDITFIITDRYAQQRRYCNDARDKCTIRIASYLGHRAGDER